MYVYETTLSLISYNIPMTNWWDACSNATFLINRLETKILNPLTNFLIKNHLTRILILACLDVLVVRVSHL